jgi:predicted aspartyl protease
MTAEPTYVTEGPPRLVGQVFTPLTIRNADDMALARRGHLLRDQVREIVLESVLVDTGATHMCLPTRMVDALGLETLREVSLATASGYERARVVGPGELEVAGRVSFVEVIELPGGEQPLLGVIPMESLGVEPDLANHLLRLLPETEPNTHFTAY